VSLYAPALTRHKPQRWGPVSRGLVAPEWQWTHDGLILALPLWAGGGPAFDLSPYRDMATLNGNVVWAMSPYGLCLDFPSGGGDYVSVPDHARFTPTQGLTVFVIAKCDAYQTDICGLVAHYLSTGNQRSWFLGLDASGHLVIALSSDGSYQAANTVVGSTVVGTTNWFTAGLTWEPSVATRVYFNGIQDGVDAAGVIASLHNSTSDLWVGTQYQTTTNYNLDGKIAAVLVYNSTLRANEVYKLHLDPFAPFRMYEEWAFKAPAGPPPGVKNLYMGGIYGASRMDRRGRN